MVTAKMNKKIFLTGYEKGEIDGFIQKLGMSKVTMLVDVRELPLSRKKGFSKNHLKRELNQAGIEYVHIKELGSPKKLRYELRKEGNYLTFFKKYRAYIRKKHIEIQKLINMIRFETICIMCFERDCELCHRSLIADEIKNLQPQLNLQPI